VRSPFDRVNTADNTPGVIHTELTAGATLRIQIMAKGGGCENRSKYKMLTPAEGIEGVKAWVLECIKTAGPDACPPLIAGVGIGGTFEKAALLSKKALFRELGSPNPDPAADALEKELLERANRLGIGPQGYGGDTTALGIHILTYPCHITSLPVAVTIECHAHRTRKPSCDQDGRGRDQGGHAAAERRGRRIAHRGRPRPHHRHALHRAGCRAWRLSPLVEGGKPLPIDVKGQIIYYTGPSPARPATWSAPSAPPPAAAWTSSPPACSPSGSRAPSARAARSQPVKDALAAAQGRLLRRDRRAPARCSRAS
jgi:hypothetical protein